MPVDVWYPATEAHRGQDMDPATMDTYEMVPGMGKTSQHAVKDAEALSGKYPLVVFSHGFGGERRQSTFFYTHLASHGYVVAAMDHVGNTTVDMISGASSAGDPAVIDQFIASRPQDASFVISQMLTGASGHTVLPDQVGMSGHSFGGWTALKTLESDTRIKAVLPLAPAGGFTSASILTMPMATPSVCSGAARCQLSIWSAIWIPFYRLRACGISTIATLSPEPRWYSIMRITFTSMTTLSKPTMASK